MKLVRPGIIKIIPPLVKPLKFNAAQYICYRSTKEPACERALHLGKSQEVTREQPAKANASAKGGNCA